MGVRPDPSFWVGGGLMVVEEAKNGLCSDRTVESTKEHGDFLAAAAGAGMRLFTAPYATDPGKEFQLPARWQETPYWPVDEVLEGFAGGAVCGITRDVFAVVDVDTKHGADIEKTRRWLDGYEVPVLAEVATPSGGRHFYVAGDDTIPRVALDKLRDLPGVEILGRTGMVYMPGTIRAKEGYEGRGYTVVSSNLENRRLEDVLKLATAIRDQVGPPGWEEVKTPATVTTVALGSGITEYGMAALLRECGKVAETLEGNRDNQLFASTAALAELVAGGEVEETLAKEKLMEAGLKTGLSAGQIRKTIGSGFKSGMRHPRSAPARVAAGGITSVSCGALGGDDEEVDPWAPVDLRPVVTAILNGTRTQLRPTLGRIDDGRALFYPSRVNSIAGESGDGKTWTALLVAVQEMDAGKHVVYIDLEDDEEGVTERLLNMGCSTEVVSSRFHYIHPDAPFDQRGRKSLSELIAQVNPSLTVIDSVGESLSLHGANPNADEEVATWFRVFPRAVARMGTGVVVIDHVTKNHDSKDLFALGSQRKRAAITGTSIIQKVEREFSRDSSGYAVLTCAKDRLGNSTRGEKVARLVVTSEGDGLVSLRLAPASDPAPWKPIDAMEKVSQLLASLPNHTAQSKKQIIDAIPMKEQTVADAINHLHGDGYVTVTSNGPGKPTTVTLVKEYCREEVGGSFQPVPTSSPLKGVGGGAEVLQPPPGGTWEEVRGGEEVKQNSTNTTALTLASGGPVWQRSDFPQEWLFASTDNTQCNRCGEDLNGQARMSACSYRHTTPHRKGDPSRGMRAPQLITLK